jgi:hypothetical protein
MGSERLKVGVEKVATRGNLTRIDLAVSVVGAGSDASEAVTAVVAPGGAAGAPRPGWQVTIPIRVANDAAEQ